LFLTTWISSHITRQEFSDSIRTSVGVSTRNGYIRIRQIGPYLARTNGSFQTTIYASEDETGLIEWVQEQIDRRRFHNFSHAVIYALTHIREHHPEL
jgi:hypothetical protein